jgi:hypothetical protein
VFYFLWLTNLKILRNKLKIPWDENAHNITEGAYFFIEINQKFSKQNAKRNFQISSSRTSLLCHDWRDVCKSERSEGQKSLHTEGDSTGYLYSATV